MSYASEPATGQPQLASNSSHNGNAFTQHPAKSAGTLQTALGHQDIIAEVERVARDTTKAFNDRDWPRWTSHHAPWFHVESVYQNKPRDDYLSSMQSVVSVAPSWTWRDLEIMVILDKQNPNQATVLQDIVYTGNQDGVDRQTFAVLSFYFWHGRWVLVKLRGTGGVDLVPAIHEGLPANRPGNVLAQAEAHVKMMTLAFNNHDWTALLSLLDPNFERRCYHTSKSVSRGEFIANLRCMPPAVRMRDLRIKAVIGSCRPGQSDVSRQLVDVLRSFEYVGCDEAKKGFAVFTLSVCQGSWRCIMIRSASTGKDCSIAKDKG